MENVHSAPGVRSPRVDDETAAEPSTSPAHAAHHVLVCLDRSALAESVLPHGIALARCCGARLTLLHIVEPGHGAGAATDPLDWEIRRSEARQYLESIAADSPDVRMVVEIGEGHAAEQIGTWAASHHVDFTVLCTHGEGGYTECGLASTAQKLIAGVAGSVLLVPASTGVPPPAREAHYARIVVPLDGSMRAESVVPLAVRLAMAHRAELVLVHVVPVPELTSIGPFAPEDLQLGERLVRRNERVARHYLERLQARLRTPELSVRTVIVVEGDVRCELASIIEREGAALTVMSAHGRTGRTEWPCGSVAAHLMAYCKTPLLVVREPPRSGMSHRGARGRHDAVAVRTPALTMV
jgi:nucleotide-binding universal stress UspA family protein